MPCRRNKSKDAEAEDLHSGARSPRAYGDQVARYFRPAKCWSLVIGSDANPRIAITRLVSETGLQEQTASIPSEKAFIIDLHLTSAREQGCEIWLDDRYFRVTEWPVGAVGIFDLESNPRVRNFGAVDWVHYHVPRSTLEAFADDIGIPDVQTLQCAYGTADPVLYRMTEMVLPSLNARASLSKLFLDYFCLLFCAHVTKAYGSSSLPSLTHCGGLAPWQRRRVMELLREHLDGSVSLTALAQECGLSVSHFARSFRRAFGRSAHQYLIQRRVERAKVLLSNSLNPLSEVALEAGFSDQASFSRTFKAIAGASPLQWRRGVHCLRSSPSYSRPGPISPTAIGVENCHSGVMLEVP